MRQILIAPTCIIAIILCVLSHDVQAQAENKNPQNTAEIFTQDEMSSVPELAIEEHFTKIDKIFTSDKPNMNEMRDYLESYMADNFVIRVHRKDDSPTNLEGFITSTQNKKDVLEIYTGADGLLYETSLRHRILDIGHNSTHNTAKVTYSSLFKGFAKFQKDDDKDWYSREFIILAQCYDLLKMEGDALKSYRAECEIESIHKDPIKL